MTEILSQAGLDAHYRTFFQQQTSDFRAANIARLVVTLLDRNRNVIDLGCGSCVVTHALLKKGFDVTSCDLSRDMLAMAREFLQSSGFPNPKLHNLDTRGSAATFPGHFQQVVCLDVIEHIKDDDAAVRDIAALLAPGGRLVLSVPAIPALFGPKDVRVGHYRRYTKQTLLPLLERNGLEINRTRYWNWLGVPVTWVSLRLLRREVNESVRRKGRGPLKASINRLLGFWFRCFENPICPPIGLTLLVVATKPEKPCDL